MSLDSYRPRETKRIIEKPETLEEQRKGLDSLIKTIDELVGESNVDIDQKWVKENENKEFSFLEPNQKEDNDQSFQDVFGKMGEVGTFGKSTYSASEQQKFNEEWDELEKLIRGSKQETPEILKPEPEVVDSKQLETIPSVEVQPVQTPIIEPISLVKEEPKSQEPVVIDNTAIIEELNSRIDKKYNHLLSELSNLYNSEVINQEANVIRDDLQSLMDIKERSLEKLKKVDAALNDLISRFAKLSQKADEIKTTDDFKINQQEQQLKSLRDYQNQLEENYGQYWFAKMTDQEKEQYITLYAAAHNESRTEVKKKIEDSIEVAYEEIVSSQKQNVEQQEKSIVKDDQPQQEKSIAQDDQPKQEQQFKGNYENIIRFNGREALETLKQVYSSLKSATPEQVEEFRNLYDSLSKLSNTKPTSYEEEQQKLNQLYDVTDRINRLQSSIGISNENKVIM